MTVSISGTNGVTFPDSSLQAAAASPYVLKNRIINGDMRIDQRNAGASVTPTNGAYTLDRFYFLLSQASKLTCQQNAASVTPPAGFTNYLGVTSSSAYTVGASEFFVVAQAIEGFNIADLGWGTANAQTVTLSFWVRSSLTGTFGGAVENSSENRNYPFSYSIPVANTWTKISITIAGDTSGTWLTTNGVGMYVIFGLGVGASKSGTAGAWGTTAYYSATGATSVVGTNGATFYITGVQLEQNTSATPFERRLYNQELANCQRYGIQLGTGEQTQQVLLPSGQGQSTTAINFAYSYAVPMRTQPTLSYSALSDLFFDDGTAGGAPSALSIVTAKSSSIIVTITSTVTGTAASRSVILRANSTTNARLFLSAEL
jgi:hypothetical protein